MWDTLWRVPSDSYSSLPSTLREYQCKYMVKCFEKLQYCTYHTRGIVPSFQRKRRKPQFNKDIYIVNSYYIKSTRNIRN